MKKKILKEYALFETEKNFTTSEIYTKYINTKNRLKADCIFIYCTPGGKNEHVAQLIEAATSGQYNIYLPAECEQDYPQYKNIKYVKNIQRALFTYAIIYTDRDLHYNYYKRTEQLLIADPILLDCNKLDDRIVWDKISSKADWLAEDREDVEIGWKKFIERMAVHHRIYPNPFPAPKKQILFLLNLDYFYPMFYILEQIVHRIDFEKYDVTVSFQEKSYKVYEKELMSLDRRVHLVTRKGKALFYKEDARRMEYLKSLGDEVTGFSDIGEFFVEAYVFRRERRRFFGRTQFDYVFNMKHDAVFWKLCLSQMEAKKIYVDINNYEKLSPEDVRRRKAYLKKYDSIVYLSKQARSDGPFAKGLTRKVHILPFWEMDNWQGIKPYPQRSDADGKQYVLLPMEKNVELDRYYQKKIAIQDNPYVILDPEMMQEEVEAIIRASSDSSKPLFVFDFYDVMKINRDGKKMEDDLIYYYFRDRKVFFGIQKYLGREIAISHNTRVNDHMDVMKYFLHKV